MMYYKHTRLFGKRSPTTVAMALDISQQFLILFWRPSPLPQTNLVATRSSSHACLVLLASSSSSSPASSSVPPGLPMCCDEIRAKLCLQVWTLDQGEGGERHGRNWNCFRDWLLRRRNRREILAPKHAPTPPSPSPVHTVCLYCQERQPLHHASCVHRRRFSA
jgi:hypothetical protein